MWIFYCMRYWPNGFIFAIGPSGLHRHQSQSENRIRLILTTRGVIAIIFGRFFESSEKGPKGGFFALDMLENNNSERKGKEKKKERGGREEETKKKQWLHS